MDEWNKRVENKIDKIVEDVGSLKMTSIEHHLVLKEHIRRTELLENAVKPLEKHVDMVNGALKLIGILGIIAGIIEAFMWAKK
jgi:hypothetical protein